MDYVDTTSLAEELSKSACHIDEQSVPGLAQIDKKLFLTS